MNVDIAETKPTITLWNKQAEILYKGKSTKGEYIRYNKHFINWFNKQYNKNKEITEEIVREFVLKEYIEPGKSTNALIAALKFRFNQCEK